MLTLNSSSILTVTMMCVKNSDFTKFAQKYVHICYMIHSVVLLLYAIHKFVFTNGTY